MGNYSFDVNGTTVIIWNSGRTLLSLDHYEQQYDFDRKVSNDNDVDFGQFLNDNIDFVLQFIEVAKMEKAKRDFYNNINTLRLARKTDNNEVIVCKVSVKRGYVSITGDLLRPEKEKNLIKWGSQNLIDHFVSEGMTKKEATKKVAEELQYNGIESLADISLFTDSFEYRKSTYYFESISCGCLHTEILQYFPELKKVIELHFKNDDQSLLRVIETMKKFQSVGNGYICNLGLQTVRRTKSIKKV